MDEGEVVTDKLGERNLPRFKMIMKAELPDMLSPGLRTFRHGDAELASLEAGFDAIRSLHHERHSHIVLCLRLIPPGELQVVESGSCRFPFPTGSHQLLAGNGDRLHQFIGRIEDPAIQALELGGEHPLTGQTENHRLVQIPPRVGLAGSQREGWHRLRLLCANG